MNIKNQTVCVSLSALMKQIEETLEDFPEYFNQLVIACPDTKHKLLSNIIDQLPNCYLSKSPGTICFSGCQDSYLSDLIRQTLVQFCARSTFSYRPPEIENLKQYASASPPKLPV